MAPSLSFQRAFALHLLAAAITHQPPVHRPKRRRCRLNLESWRRRRLVGAKGLRP